MLLSAAAGLFTQSNAPPHVNEATALVTENCQIDVQFLL